MSPVTGADDSTTEGGESAHGKQERYEEAGHQEEGWEEERPQEVRPNPVEGFISEWPRPRAGSTSLLGPGPGSRGVGAG